MIKVVSIQVAASSGYITVHWDKVEKDVKSAFDENGDGEVRVHVAQLNIA